jgi:hypothetical protein
VSAGSDQSEDVFSESNCQKTRERRP